MSPRVGQKVLSIRVEQSTLLRKNLEREPLPGRCPLNSLARTARKGMKIWGKRTEEKFIFNQGIWGA